MPHTSGQSPTVTDLIRSFLATCLEPRPDCTVEAAALCTAYRQWSRWQGCGTLTDASLLRVTGAVLGQAGLDGPIETVTGYALRNYPILRFLLERTRLQADARISVNALYVAYLCWLDDAPRHGRQGSFHDQVSALIGPSETGPARHAPGPVRLWLGLTLDDGLPEDAIAPGDLTDAAELRARPLNRREVA